jgi:hypothetical protein
MERMSWLDWQAWLAQPVPRSLINEPLTPEPETPTQRARRRWHMPEVEGDVLKSKGGTIWD